MKKTLLVLFAVIFFCSSYADDKLKLSGTWAGMLKISSSELRIVFNVTINDDSSLTTTLDSPDQGAFAIVVDKTTYKENTVRFDINAIGGFYEGIFDPDSMKITGTWNQAGMSLPLVLTLSEKPAELNRPQEPKGPFPYNEEEVSYPNADAGISLAGTLTTPKTGGPFPVVILITGSGPQNRNEEILTHKPFLVIADYLTRNGIAVLRFDDRGVGQSTGNYSTATSEDFAGDVLAGIDFLKTRNEIDQDKLGLIGHSEGGLIAPVVASISADVSFIVLLAGPGIRGDQLLLLQAELISKSEGIEKDEIEKTLDLSQKFYKIINANPDDSIARINLLAVFEEYYNTLDEAGKNRLGDIEVLKAQQFNALLSPWFRYFLSFDPVPYLKKVRCPVLALNGEKDLQVPPGVNLEAIEEALIAGGNNNFVVKELKGLNHLFQTSETGSISEYAKLEETFSTKALEEILKWIKSVTD